MPDKTAWLDCSDSVCSVTKGRFGSGLNMPKGRTPAHKIS